MVAVQRENVEAVRYLVETGHASIGLRNNQGKTAIDMAKRNDIKEYLREKYLNPISYDEDDYVPSSSSPQKSLPPALPVPLVGGGKGSDISGLSTSKSKKGTVGMPISPNLTEGSSDDEEEQAAFERVRSTSHTGAGLHPHPANSVGKVHFNVNLEVNLDALEDDSDDQLGGTQKFDDDYGQGEDGEYENDNSYFEPDNDVVVAQE